jgi:aryl-alcohol dehydrogenase-like predicted oxidoreductase
MHGFVNSEESRTASRLVLGTAQLGMPYGIANSTGKPDFETAVEIVKTAWDRGIREFDTAQAYGESEAVLGKAFLSLGISPDVKIITKLDPKLEPHQGQEIKRAVKQSLERLHVPSLYGLLLHREAWLDSLNHGLGKTLAALVEDGTVKHLGVSLYTPGNALRALADGIMDMIQVPANILDRRFADAGVFDLARETGKQVYIRSVFLQGLLLMKPGELPANMAFARPALTKMDNFCAQYHYSRHAMALLYIKWKYPQARIIIGAEMPIQLEENLFMWQDNSASMPGIDEVDGWPMVPERVINPALWS